MRSCRLMRNNRWMLPIFSAREYAEDRYGGIAETILGRGIETSDVRARYSEKPSAAGMCSAPNRFETGCFMCRTFPA
jgi:hypothetical protein